ncbi:MAG: response regulator transcription factor [Acidocella sp.]|nr:response regulator transcription factor [Acidocella sp.]
MRILIVEDDPEMRDYLMTELRHEGHEVTSADDGRAGLVAAMSDDYAMLIVDRMLPKLDGLGMVTALRSAGLHMPVIFLTALGRVDERVDGLRAGADDYLVKPFAPVELFARIENLSRRNSWKPVSPLLKIGDLELNRLSKSVTRGGRNILLKNREFRLLEYLMQNAGKVVTRTMMLEAVWDFHFDPQTSLVESHISRIRAKMDTGFSRELIHTIRGAGYRIGDTPGT